MLLASYNLMTSQRRQSLFILSIIIVAACARLLQFVPNFAPITALAVFSAFTLRSRLLATFLPIMAMIVGDVLLAVVRNDWGYAFHDTQVVVYATMIATVALSRFVAHRGTRFSTVAFATLGGSVLFFIVTNFAVWAFGSMYAHTPNGLLECYTMALPFFRNAALADALYAAAMFGVLVLGRSRSVRLA